LNLKLCLSIFLLLCGLNFPSSFAIGVNGGGSKVVSGDAFGKFYGKGVGALAGWNESNPFGINTVMSGPTTRYCPKPFRDRPERESTSYREPSSTNDDRDDGRGNAPLLVSMGSDLDSDRNYAEGMEGVIESLRVLQGRRCRSGDTTVASCEVRSGNDHSSGRCWQAVKIALKEANVVDEYISSGSAIEAHSEGLLEKAGFCQVQVSDSNEAPVGSIMVYTWNQNKVRDWNNSCSNQPSCRVVAPKHGHIEVKAGDNEYLSDIQVTVPMDKTASNNTNGSPKRTLAGVYVKGPCNDE